MHDNFRDLGMSHEALNPFDWFRNCTGYVDRLFGITPGLLPHSYDVCELSHALLHADQSDRKKVLGALEKVERDVESWQPSLPPKFVADFTTTEVVHMLPQAEQHRIAALLFIHRLQHPFGSKDDIAERLARRILSDLDRAQNVTNERVRCVSLPFFMAAINTLDKAERLRILDLVSEHIDPTTPVIQEHFRMFISGLWQVRDASTGFFWLDLLAHLPSIIIPP